MEILRGWGVSRAKIFKRNYEAKLEFPEGWGFKAKTIRGGGIDNYYFLEQHNLKPLYKVLFFT